MHELTPGGPAFDAIVEGVGGASLGGALQRVTADGTVVSFANSDPNALTTFPAHNLSRRAPGTHLYGLRVFAELDEHHGATRLLGRLVDLVAAGRLDPHIDLEASWREPGEAIHALLDRRLAGKAVLHVD